MPLEPHRRWRWWAPVAGSLLVAVVSMPVSQAQVPPLFPPPTTTSTTAPPSGASSAPPPPAPSGDDLADGAAKAPPGAEDAGGDGAAAPSGGIRVPPEAQKIIDSIDRTGRSSNDELLGRLATLEDMGLPRDEAYRVGLGRFPIAGSARYGHDWLYPRYGPGFRFHLGTDVFAAYGTPVRAPVDGIARTRNGGLGGLTVKVVMPDGTYFYLAHLSGLVDGFVDGMPVKTGDIVGFVGDSGNAKGGSPHLHIGVYPHGGPPVDPKPILDGFIAEAEARLPQVVAALAASAPATPVTTEPPAADEQARLRPMLATGLLHPLAAGGAGVPEEVLYLAAASPLQGPRTLVDLALTELVSSIDWSTRPTAG